VNKMECVFGTETELGLVADSAHEVRPAGSELAPAIVRDLADKYPSLPANTPKFRVFLGNGASVYVDIGGHPEIASAECANPFDLVAHTLACRQMLAASAANISRVYGIPIRLICNNVDYSLSRAHTYGFHLNILVRKISLSQISQQLSPLLAAMPILSGAGKVSFANGSSGFELSQRALQMSFELGQHTTSSRAMITCKNESLNKEGHRLHLISFDTVMNQWQLALVPAILVLVLKVIESGKENIAGPMLLADPIQALHTVSCDPSLTASLPLQKGGDTTALAILDHYRTEVAQFLSQTDTPGWAQEMVALWGDITKTLQTNPFCEHRVDWVNKLLILTRHLENNKLDWKEYSRWIFALASVRRIKASFPEIDLIRMTRSPDARLRIPRSALMVLESHFAKNDLRWDTFGKIWRISNQLCQRCLQYHVLNPGSVSQAYADSSILVSKEKITKALEEPPLGTRAVVRGEAIRNEPSGGKAGWTFVEHGGKRLVINDVFGKDAVWQQISKNSSKAT